MAGFDLIDNIEERSKAIASIDAALGRGLMMPNNSANSGSRKLMYSVQVEQCLPLYESEVPLLGTGYESRYGEKSSSFLQANDEYLVISKISKFNFDQDREYLLIVKSATTGIYDVIQRISFQHVTVTYGYLLNNEYLDSLMPGDTIHFGDVIQKSLANDKYNNRMDGVNLITTYIASEFNKEDGIIISDVAAEKLAAPLIKRIPIQLNDNDIPLNLYGDYDNYKTIPDLGEDVKGGIVCALRREKKEESLFSQSYNRLRDIMLSDEKYPAAGRVEDISIYCNSPENMTDSFYNSQLKVYYDSTLTFNQAIVEALKDVVENGVHEFTYAVGKLYDTALQVISGVNYLKDRVFSNILLEIVLIERSPVRVGDKIANRYGGKGVVSRIVPQHLMPRLDNGEYVEVIYNPATCINRENLGQLLESSITHVGSKLVDMIGSQVFHFDECLELYFKYLYAVVPEQAQFIENSIAKLDEDSQIMYLQSIVSDCGINISMKPITEAMDIDRVNYMYSLFSDIGKYKVSVPITDSNGNTRYIKTNRDLVCGKQYIYRLKQYAEEKFSATSLSATNLRSENSRSSAKRSYKVLHQKTPIRFGEMEMGDLSHLDMEVIITNFMIHSASPMGRRLCEQLYTKDPFDIDIKLDGDSRNRAVEKVNTKLFTMGLRLKFTKTPKLKKNIFTKDIVSFDPHVRDLVEFNNRYRNLVGVDLNRIAENASGKSWLFTRDLVTFRSEIDESK